MRPRDLLCATLVAAATGCAPAGQPTVLLVVVDTMRADRLSVYGAERPTTPRLAARAADAAVFERAFATSPWTVPSMGSLLTGLLPAAHGAGQRTGKRHGFEVLREDVETLAERLAAHGYETAAIVNNVFLAPGFGLHRGFDRYDHAPATDLELRRAGEVVDLALAWLREREGAAFLLVHLMDPHIAYDPPPDVRGRFTADLESSRFSLPVRTPAAIRRQSVPGPEDTRFVAAAYDEELLAVDRALDRLLAERAGGLLEGALVLLTSDHGEEFFEHGGFEHGHALHRELLHVPFIVWGPGVRAGRYAEPVSLVDVPPTVLEALGREVPPGLAGRSLFGLIARGDALPPRDLVAEALLRGPERRAILRWPWKLDVRRGTGRVRLFDLERDFGEQTNLAARHPELVDELRRALEGTGEGAARSTPGREAAIDEETRRNLEGLGYGE